MAAATVVAGGGTLDQLIAQPALASPGGKTDSEGGVVILLYDGMTALDAVGPYEVLRLVPGVRVRFAATQAGLIKADSGLNMLNAEHALHEIEKADILLVPGGDARQPLQDTETLEFIRRLHQTTTWTTSVCIGSMILGAAGVLQGLSATTHWSVLDQLPYVGAKPVQERFVRDGKVMTAAGVSAGVDMALALVGTIYGEELARTIQLIIEYDPQPPFNSGSVLSADAAMVERARAMLREIYS